MRVGVSLFPQNYGDWARFEAAERDKSVEPRPVLADASVLDDDIRLGNEVEALGFDSLWSVEHHFAPYTMINNPLQMLTYFAGRTEKIDLGTCVVVLPWHNPIRVAEDAVTLQHLLGTERNLKLGVGRGLGRREFAGFGIDMNETRGRFQESVEIIKAAITQPTFSYDGEYFKVPETELRPGGDPRIVENMHCAWGSPQSVPIAANLGLKPIVIPQKQWAEYSPELEVFAQTRDTLGLAPARPTIMVYMYCSPTAEAAEEGAQKYFTEYADSTLRQYELGANHFSTLKGYEHYAEHAQAMADSNIGARHFANMFLENHIWGTPDQCIEKVEKIESALTAAPAEIIVVPKYGSMPYDEARDSLRLFGREVLPSVHKLS
jgi:alkanesulfonate monooxygenase SsuD/methylene tetrahydromethanopterin reductase-like flavin-dependent oxidoreductase (luciferase family)